MPKALILDRVASAIVRSDPTGWNIPENLTGSPVSTPNGTMSSISKSITSPIRTLWCNPSSSTWITALDAQHLADQRGKPGHRSTQLAAEDLDELVELRVRRAVVDEHTDPPVAFRHHLRRVGDESGLAPGDVRAVNGSLTNIEDESHATEVVRGSVIH